MYGIEDTEGFFKSLETEKSNPVQSTQLIQSKDVEPKQVQHWTIKSSSNPTKSYTVSLSEVGFWSCICPHWTYRKTECKHIKQCKPKT